MSWSFKAKEEKKMCDYQKARRKGFGFLVLVCYFCKEKKKSKNYECEKGSTKISTGASSDMTSSPAHIQRQVSQQDPGSLAPH